MSNLRVSAAVVAVALFAPPEVAAQEGRALRAPLDILDPAIRRELRAGAAVKTPDAKLAPKAAARQMARPVRAIAALPGSETDVVQVGQLGVLEDSPVGLEDGYGADAWGGARRAYVVPLMARLPKRIRLAALRDMEIRLHKSRTAAPAGAVDATSWFAARLTRLLDLGAGEAALRLAALTGATRSDAYAARAVAETHLARGANNAACAVPHPRRSTRGRRGTRAFFLELKTYCHLAKGRLEEAALALELNETALGRVPLFRDMAFALAASAPFDDKLVLPAQLSIMQYAMVRLAADAPAYEAAALPLSVAASAAQVADAPPLRRVRLGLRAVEAGTLTAPEFLALVQTLDLADDEAESPPPEIALALALRRLQETPPAEVAALLPAALRHAAAADMWAAGVRIVAPYLHALYDVSEEEISEDEVSEDDAPPPPDARMAAARAYLQLPVPETSELAWVAQIRTPSAGLLVSAEAGLPAVDAPPVDVFNDDGAVAVWHGLGYDVGNDVRRRAGLDAEATAAHKRLEKLATEGWRGDLILALVSQYGARPPAALAPADIAAMLTALRTAGLEAEARALASEILILRHAARGGADG